nr:MAG TPA: hypothetical protein [Caudoviricetes sp.]DAH86052.1 MAG TPA: hypothetical protein [Caudoviricetes sp.]
MGEGYLVITGPFGKKDPPPSSRATGAGRHHMNAGTRPRKIRREAGCHE